MTEAAHWQVSVPHGALEVVHEAARAHRGPDAVFVFAHGAGGHRDDARMTAMTSELRDRGFGVVRFNFPYRELGLGRPDPMPVLVATIAGVAEQVRSRLAPRTLILGGRSMGGRAASVLAADGFACEGLLLLAYPLHPAGQPARLRVEHLARIHAPVLCLNGTRDKLCDRARMEEAIAPLRPWWTMHWLEGADHAFHVLKRSGRSDAEVVREAGDAAQRWLAALGQ